MKLLIVVDMQNDFIDGALGSKEAVAIVPYVKQKIESFDGKVFFTRDTHFNDYMSTQEGKNLPVPHCIQGTHGWEIRAELDALRKTDAIDKITFGSKALVEIIAREENVESITFVGALHRHLCDLQRDADQGVFPRNPPDRGCQGLRRGHPRKPSNRAERYENVPSGNFGRIKASVRAASKIAPYGAFAKEQAEKTAILLRLVFWIAVFFRSGSARFFAATYDFFIPVIKFCKS